MKKPQRLNTGETVTCHVRMPKEARDRLHAIAAWWGVSISHLVQFWCEQAGDIVTTEMAERGRMREINPSEASDAETP